MNNFKTSFDRNELMCITNMCEELELSAKQLLKQALRHYQLIVAVDDKTRQEIDKLITKSIMGDDCYGCCGDIE